MDREDERGQKASATEASSSGRLTRAKLYGVVAVALGLIATLVVIAEFGFETLNGVRGFVGAEGRWAKNQKDMTHQLLLYLETGDEAHWRHYERQLAALRSVRDARIELDRPAPDLAAVTKDFDAIGTPPGDVVPMAKLFTRFRSVDHVDRAARVWARADAAVARFADRAAEIRQQADRGELVGQQRRRAMEEIDQREEQLHELEDEFSDTLGTAARWAQGVLDATLTVIGLIAAGLCFALGWSGRRAIDREHRYGAVLRLENEVKSVQGELSEAIGGQLSEEKIATRALRVLARELGAQAAALYAPTGPEQLRLVGSYGLDEKKRRTETVALGEGLVGQVAVDRTPLVVDEIPEDYVKIRSGTGESPPRSLLLHPLVVDGELRGVVELAATGTIDERAGEILEATASPIGHALWAARARAVEADLLKRTREQAAELTIFGKLVNKAGQGIGLCTLEGEVTFVNDELRAMLGEATAEDAVGKEIASYYPDAIRRRLEVEVLPQVMRTGQWRGESKLLSTDGRETPIIENLFLIRDDEGNPLRLGDVMTDISEQKETERRLQELNEELQVQQEELRQANDELAEQSRALEESQERLEIQQRELEETNADLEERTEALERHRRAVEAQNAELEEAREAIAEKARALEGTSRYKSEFLANMSHELRTPLNSIIILSGLLADNREQNLTDKQIEYARTVNESGSDLLELINELLDLSKIEAGKMTLLVDAVDLDGLLTSLRRQFTPVANEKQLAFSAERGNGVPSRIRSDGQRITQIARNLLSNAFKFTHEGSVRLTIARPTAAEIEEAGLDAPATEQVAISVEDTGIGIPPDKQQVIFQAFQQADGATDRKYGGTGLGLTITEQFVRLLGGRILMRSTPGRGSRFTVVLPERAMADPEGSVRLISVPPVSAPPRTVPTAALSTSSPSITVTDEVTSKRPKAKPSPEETDDDRDGLTEADRSILIIEDDQRFARTLADLARERDFKVLLAPDGSSGLELAERYRPSAILLDLGLPGMDGMTVMSQLKDDLATRHIPVHVISGRGQKLETLKAGALGFLQKPVSMALLDSAFERIEGLLDKPVKDLLVVVGDEDQREAVVELIGAKDVAVVEASTAEEAMEILRQRRFDCVVLDLELPDTGGAELLERVRRSDGFSDTPVVALTQGDLPRDEQLLLDRYADRVVPKGEKLPMRLLDETALFLHRVERDLPEEKRKLIEMLHDKEAILRGRKVLVVDDDMRNVFALSAVLEGKEMTVVVAKHGKEALTRLEEHPDVDLVLMDIMMPEMDGYEAMRRIREMEAFRALPIIALTAKAMKEDRAKCIEAGASDYLSKPVDTDRLLSVLRVWLYR